MRATKLELLSRLGGVGRVGYARWVTPLLIVLVIGVLGAEMAGLRWNVVKDLTFIGHSDEAAYATMGKSLSEGKGLQVPYITWFFIPYDPNITRREDHWPPFISFCMAPFFKMYGVSAPVAKLPAVLIGSIGLPLATALLTWRLSRRGYVAIIAGLIVMSHHLMYTESLKTLSDVPAAMVMAFFFWALIAARTSPWMHLLAGFFAAMCYYAKGSEIMLAGLYPGLAVLATGFHVPGKRAAIVCGVWTAIVLLLWIFIGGWITPVFLILAPAMLMVAGPTREKSHWPWIGMAAAALLVAPFLYSNLKLFGDPLHTTQNYVVGYHGLDDWEAPSYYVYWGQDLPKAKDRWDRFGRPVVEDVATGQLERTHLVAPRRFDSTAYPKDYWSYSADQRAEMARLILLGVEEDRSDTRRVGGKNYSENQWDGLGYVGRWWEDYFRGPVKEVTETGGRNEDRRPALAPDALRWDSSKNFLGATWKFAWDAWERSKSWTNRWPRLIGMLAGATLLVVIPGGLLWWAFVWGWRTVRKIRGGKLMPEQKTETESLFWGPVIAMTLIILIHAVLLAYFWRVVPRFAFPLVPLITAIGCAGFARLVDSPIEIAARVGSRFVKSSWLKTAILNWHVPVTIMVAIYIMGRAPTLKADFIAEHKPFEREGWPYRDPWGTDQGNTRWDDTRNRIIGEYLKAQPELAGTVIMCRNPWEILFYAGDQKGVAIPYGDAATIFAVARYYRVTHLLYDPVGFQAARSRPELRDWLTEQARLPESQRGVRRIATVENAPLYELDYSKLPNRVLPGMNEPPANPPKYTSTSAKSGVAAE